MSKCYQMTTSPYFFFSALQGHCCASTFSKTYSVHSHSTLNVQTKLLRHETLKYRRKTSAEHPFLCKNQIMDLLKKLWKKVTYWQSDRAQRFGFQFCAQLRNGISISAVVFELANVALLPELCALAALQTHRAGDARIVISSAGTWL